MIRLRKREGGFRDFDMELLLSYGINRLASWSGF